MDADTRKYIEGRPDFDIYHSIEDAVLSNHGTLVVVGLNRRRTAYWVRRTLEALKARANGLLIVDKHCGSKWLLADGERQLIESTYDSLPMDILGLYDVAIVML